MINFFKKWGCSNKIDSVNNKGSNKTTIDEKNIEDIKIFLNNAKESINSIDKEIQKAEQKKVKQKGVKRAFSLLKNLIWRIDVKSGTNLVKVILWIGMAWTIVKFSTDINSKIIGSLTYFLGIMIDMALLRKQLPQVGVEILRIFAGVLFIGFTVIVVLLCATLMLSAQSFTIDPNFDECLNWALFIAGFLSTFVEFVNSICADD